MPNRKHDLEALKRFLPENTFDKIIIHLQNQPIHLIISKDRKTILGNYRPPINNEHRHRVTVNGTLNKYAFLITLLHELAHLYTYIKYKHTVRPHGSEWKSIYSELLKEYIIGHVFPEDISNALIQYVQNIKSSTCTDANLYKVLSRYNINSHQSMIFVDEVPFDTIFITKDGKRFCKIEKLRTRYKCKEVETNKIYFVPGIMEVYVDS